MKNVKKIIMVCGIVLLIITTASCITRSITQGKNNKLIAEHRDTIIRLGDKLKVEEERNRQLAEINSRIGKELADNIRRAGEAEKALGSISTGLSGDVSTVRQIIESVRSIRKAIEEYYQPEKLASEG